MNLLVSVRSVEEAAAAIEGGAGLIDVKEPSRGSLGRADRETIAAIVRYVNKRLPVSFASGELLHATSNFGPDSSTPGAGYVKWGLAGCAQHRRWTSLLDSVAKSLPTTCCPVAVAYADWQRAQSPPPTQVCEFACARRWGAFLVDTWIKDGQTLLDFLSLSEIERLRDRCREAGVAIALAGSLDLPQIERLLPVAPDWFAVRGAVCDVGGRKGKINAARVRRLAEAVASFSREASAVESEPRP